MVSSIEDRESVIAMLPRLFVGSSKEAQEAGLLDELLKALHAGLNATTPTVELIPWTKSPWKNMAVATETLVDNLVEYSYGVFILSADDAISLRNNNQYTARDNVIFEFGLFLGHLGRERTFLLGPSNPAKTVALSAVRTSVAHKTRPVERPLRILTDLGSAYRMGSYTITDPGVAPAITFHVDEVVGAINAIEAKASGLGSTAAQCELNEVLLTAKAEIGKSGKGDAYYSGQFFSRFRDLATLKARATTKSVQAAVQDLLLYFERIPDLCDIGQLAREQHHSKGISEVWVFADRPLEFRAATTGDPMSSALRTTITENLRQGVKYVYFVGPDFNNSDVDFLVDGSDPQRGIMLDSLQVVKVNSQFFSTYFTLHFRKPHKSPAAIYMSSVMRDRMDVLIQVSDTEHVRRIYDRIRIIRGVPEQDHSPRVTRYAL